jgi:hypothetical protein
MPDLHNIFLQFDKSISLTPSRRKRLTTAKKAVENAIKAHFRNERRIVIPNFFIQGSYKMNTMIVKKDNTYDVDLGVYFLTKPNLEAKTLQQNVYRAVSNQTQGGATHKQKCIRVNYQGEFNIDLPVYYYDRNSKTSYLATKFGWEKSDPKELVDWYFQNGGEELQLNRIIKYLKAWSDNHKYKMPSGIALSVWATQKYSAHKRDDIALYNTLLGMKKSNFWNGVRCINPASPGDDLTAKLNDDQKSRFKSEVKKLLNDLDVAIESDNQTASVKVLKSHFGKRFVL